MIKTKLIGMGSLIVAAAIFGILDFIFATNKFKHDNKDTEAFEYYLKQFGKGYKSLTNYNKRKENFQKMLEQIRKQDDEKFVIGFNRMSDWNEDEYQSVIGVYTEDMRYGAPQDPDQQKTAFKVDVVRNYVGVNKTIDWTLYSPNLKPQSGLFKRKQQKQQQFQLFTNIKDQTQKKQCSASYAFAVVSAIEANYKIQTNETLYLSEQQLVDCTNIKLAENPSEYQNRGCSGGYIQDTLQYVVDKPLFKDKSYPYKAFEGKCKQLQAFNGKNGERDYVQLKSFKKLQTVPQILEAIQRGPIIATIKASSLVFRDFEKGTIPSDTLEGPINHAVIVIGFDLNEGHFLIKNTFGNKWGQNGIAKIEMSLDGSGLGEAYEIVLDLKKSKDVQKIKRATPSV